MNHINNILLYNNILMNNYTIRELKKEDYYKGHLELYQELSKINIITIDFNQYENFVSTLNNKHKIFVIEDNNNIIGTITVLIENKLIRNVSRVGHIEDVVIKKEYNGKGLGKKLVEHCVLYCKNNGCYKVILDCEDDKIGFYEKCGFKRKDNGMKIYF